MSISEIRENINDLENMDKDTLVRYVQELLVHEKRQNSKIMSHKTEIKFLHRHMKQIKNRIDKTLNSSINHNGNWEGKEK